jgi:hypothetical protein
MYFPHISGLANDRYTDKKGTDFDIIREDTKSIAKGATFDFNCTPRQGAEGSKLAPATLKDAITYDLIAHDTPAGKTASTINATTGLFTAGNIDEHVIVRAKCNFADGFAGSVDGVGGTVKTIHYSYQVMKVGTGDPVTVTPPVGSAYDTWAAAITDAGSRAKDFDSDKDGTSNLIEFALGMDPTVASASGLPQVGTAGGKTTLTYTKGTAALTANPAVVYTVEGSSDLVTWNTTGLTSTTTGNTTVTTDSTIVTGGLKRFLRLKVTN